MEIKSIDLLEFYNTNKYKEWLKDSSRRLEYVSYLKSEIDISKFYDDKNKKIISFPRYLRLIKEEGSLPFINSYIVGVIVLSGPFLTLSWTYIFGILGLLILLVPFLYVCYLINDVNIKRTIENEISPPPKKLETLPLEFDQFKRVLTETKCFTYDVYNDKKREIRTEISRLEKDYKKVSDYLINIEHYPKNNTTEFRKNKALFYVNSINSKIIEYKNLINEIELEEDNQIYLINTFVSEMEIDFLIGDDDQISPNSERICNLGIIVPNIEIAKNSIEEFNLFLNN